MVDQTMDEKRVEVDMDARVRQVAELYNAGKKYREMEAELDLSPGAVVQAVKQAQSLGLITRMRGRGNRVVIADTVTPTNEAPRTTDADATKPVGATKPASDSPPAKTTNDDWKAIEDRINARVDAAVKKLEASIQATNERLDRLGEFADTLSARITGLASERSEEIKMISEVVGQFVTLARRVVDHETLVLGVVDDLKGHVHGSGGETILPSLLPDPPYVIRTGSKDLLKRLSSDGESGLRFCIDESKSA